MLGPVYVARNSRDYKVRTFFVYAPQEDLRFIGYVPVARFNTLAEAEAKRDELLAAGSFYQDDKGWWRRSA